MHIHKHIQIHVHMHKCIHRPIQIYIYVCVSMIFSMLHMSQAPSFRFDAAMRCPKPAAWCVRGELWSVSSVWWCDHHFERKNHSLKTKKTSLNIIKHLGWSLSLINVDKCPPLMARNITVDGICPKKSRDFSSSFNGNLMPVWGLDLISNVQWCFFKGEKHVS